MNGESKEFRILKRGGWKNQESLRKIVDWVGVKGRSERKYF